MGFVSRRLERCGGSRAIRKTAAASAVLLGMCAMGGAQAATLTCGAGATPVRITTIDRTQWSTDALNSPSGTPAAIVDDFISSTYSWFNPATIAQPIAARWLSFGTVNEGGYPLVSIQGDRANGAWVTNRGTFIYNEAITIGPEVNLASIRITGRGGADNNVRFAVRPATLPGGVANSGSEPWVRDTAFLGSSWTAPTTIDVDGGAGGLGFYYGDNTIGLSVSSEYLNTGQPGGVVADFEIAADCLTPVAAQPTTPLICPVGNAAGDTVRIGPFTTNARDWRWTWRTNSSSAPQALENVEQPLFDDFIWRSYFKPGALPAGQETAARWISPGTVDPAGTDIPGVPYPLATGQAKSGYYGALFTLNQPLTVGNNVDLTSIRLDGRFGFDDTGDSVFVQPAGQPAPTSFPHLLPDGYGSFTSYTTNPIPGFARGQNTIGLVLNGGQFSNDCRGGACALAAIADFYVTATCTGAAPIDPTQPVAATPVPVLDAAGLGLLSLLGAGAGAMALRRCKRAE